MKKVAIVTGVLLVIIGLVGYLTPQVVVTEGPEGEVVETIRSWTALIPAFVGLPILLCGLWVVINPTANKTAMHIAATFGLLGALASTLRGVGLLFAFVQGDADFNPRTFAFLGLMGLLCWMFVLFCIVSFVRARKARETSPPSDPAK